MKVKQLIEQLRDCNPDSDVYMSLIEPRANDSEHPVDSVCPRCELEEGHELSPGNGTDVMILEGACVEEESVSEFRKTIRP